MKKRIIKTDRPHEAVPHMKVGEIIVFLKADPYRLGNGEVHVQLPFKKGDASDEHWNRKEVTFSMKGGNDSFGDTRAEASWSSFHGDATDTVLYGKAVQVAGEMVSKSVSAKDKKEAKAKIRIDIEERRKRDEEAKADRERRKLQWVEDYEGELVSVCGLFRIAKNSNPKWKEGTKKWLVTGPSYEANYDYKKGWDKLELEVAVKSVKDAKAQAQYHLERMISKELVEEIDKTGVVKKTKTMIKRMAEKPYTHRDNTSKKEVA